MPYKRNTIDRWDSYFLNVCEVIASNSMCMSRHNGAILVRDHSIIATGYNGPPRGVPHCGKERIERDHNLRDRMTKTIDPSVIDTNRCPRKVMGYAPGDGLDWCPAAHAEQNCIAHAARLGVNVNHTHLYMNDQIPCKICLATLIDAGIALVTVTRLECYDEESSYLIKYSDINVRDFNGRVWS